MNIGKAVRSQEFEAAHIDVASTCPAGVATFVRTATNPHTRQRQRNPYARAENSEQQQHQHERELEHIHGQPSLPKVIASSAARKLGRPRLTTMNSSSTSAIVRIRAPRAIAACG